MIFWGFWAVNCFLMLMALGLFYKIFSFLKKDSLKITDASFRIKIVRIFSGFVLGPSLIMAIFAIIFLQVGLQAWFHERVKTALEESYDVAKAYLKEHQESVQSTIKDIAQGLDDYFNTLFNQSPSIRLDALGFFKHHKEDLENYLTAHEAFRSVKEAIIFQIPKEANSFSSKAHFPLQVMAQSKFSLSVGFKTIALSDIQQAQKKGIFISVNDKNDQIFAIVPLFAPLKAYLLVSRDIDTQVLKKITRATKAANAYDYLLKTQSHFAFQFIIIFSLFTLVLLLFAIWGGLYFSQQLMVPIEQLIDASLQIQQGHLKTVQPDGNPSMKELNFLINTFNAMVHDVTHQKEKLLDVNAQLKQQVNFIEKVLSGVSSGVLSLDKQGQILLCNKQANILLNQEDLKGHFLRKIIPEFQSLWKKGFKNTQHIQQTDCRLWRQGKLKIFKVSVLVEKNGKSVLTFDDITELFFAQKKAAWSDVARRVAHEVKNPLTPVLLSAERLKRRYLPYVENPDIFKDCIETIIRQVSYLGKLISEFSSFARMPAPLLKEGDLTQLVQQVTYFHQNAYPDITFQFLGIPLKVAFDPHQIEQVLNNLFKNSIEAIQEKATQYPDQAQDKKIIIQLQKKDNTGILTVEDNGIGLLDESLNFEEPYLTTKPEGTGLGLAIVRKILDDHSFKFNLEKTKTGCLATLTFELL